MAAAHKKVASHFLLRFYVPMILVFCFFSIKTFAAALVRAFSSHCTLLIWWVGPTHIDKRRVYGLPVAINIARFIAFCRKLEYGRFRCIFAYISMTIRARDFKFAGTPVLKLQLAMVASTKKSFPVHYMLGFLVEGHI